MLRSRDGCTPGSGTRGHGSARGRVQQSNDTAQEVLIGTSCMSIISPLHSRIILASSLTAANTELLTALGMACNLRGVSGTGKAGQPWLILPHLSQI
jgi:hypothetical protein